MKAILFFGVLLSACGEPPQILEIENEALRIYNRTVGSVCLKGARYYIWGSSLSPAFNEDGEVQRCK